MDKYVFAILLLDESETFSIVEPFHFSTRHQTTPFFRSLLKREKFPLNKSDQVVRWSSANAISDTLPHKFLMLLLDPIDS
jgi:hypothetical protein